MTRLTEDTYWLSDMKTIPRHNPTIDNPCITIDDHDIVSVLWSNRSFYVRQFDAVLALHYDQETNAIIGYTLQGIRGVLKDADEMRSLSEGQVE